MKYWHGHAAGRKLTPEYRTWLAIKRRCLNARCREYKWYGGRGISICKEWRHDFMAFLSHVGKRPDGKSIDRIDSNGHYEPGNVRWATVTQQSRNRRNNVYIDIGGSRMTIAQIEARYKVKKVTLWWRYKKGWRGDRLISRASRMSNAKVSRTDVIRMRVLRERGRKLSELSAVFGISVPAVHSIVMRKTWRGVK